MPAGEGVPAWARCEGGSAAAAADSWTGGEEEEGRGLSRVGRAFMP